MIGVFLFYVDIELVELELSLFVVDLAILILAYIDSCVYSISELVVNGCAESPTRLATLL